jgi:hypothetical protein
MVAVKLDQSAVNYVRSSLADANGGLAAHVATGAFRDPVVFVDEGYDLAKLHDLESQGITKQAEANKRLAAYIKSLRTAEPSLNAVLFQDPGGKPEDFAYATNIPHALMQLPRSLLAFNEQRYFLYDIAATKRRAIWQYRGWCVSYLKMGYVLQECPDAIRAAVAAGHPDLLAALARTVRHVLVNAYDDESWIAVAHTPSS